jgi:hypothetical protein
MNLSDVFRDNAEDCAFLAERAEDGEIKRALKRMEEAWRTLAREQQQLENKRWSTKCRACEAADFCTQPDGSHGVFCEQPAGIIPAIPRTENENDIERQRRLHWIYHQSAGEHVRLAENHVRPIPGRS